MCWDIRRQHLINHTKHIARSIKIGMNGRALRKNGKQLYKTFLMKVKGLNNSDWEDYEADLRYQ